MVQRRMLFLAAAAGAMGFWLRPEKVSAAHSAYFASLNESLKQNAVDKPSLIIDLDRLDRNVDLLMANVGSQPDRVLRLVTKSLPSPGLLRYVAGRANTNAFMAFHRPFLQALAQDFPDSNILLGKPMPVAAAARFYEEETPGFAPAKQLQWLIDTPERLAEYLALAKSRGLELLVNLELDVGLHRGGFDDEQTLRSALMAIKQNRQHLKFAGFMGYDAHLAKLPGFVFRSEFARVQERYERAKLLAAELLPEEVRAGLCFNGAGSPTFSYYSDSKILNDIAVGSCLVKPKDFDLDPLQAFLPSAFIASPVLKKQAYRGVPSQGWARRLQTAWNPNKAMTYFAYGGNWLAEVESPRGLAASSMYLSSNQQGYSGSDSVTLDVNDFIFLRPAQSESVFLQFGDILAMRDGALVDSWPVLSQST